MREFIGQIFYPVLSMLHTLTNEWVITIILFTLIVKLLLSPLSYKIARQQKEDNEKKKELIPKLKELQEEYKANPLEMLAKQKELEAQNGINPNKMMKLIIINGIVMMVLYTVFSINGVHMASSIIPWVKHFSVADPLHILPLIVVFTSFLSNLLTNGTEVVEISLKQRTGFAVMIALFSLIFLWHSPIALAIYWITSNLCTIIEKFFFKKHFKKRASLLESYYD